MLPGLSLADGWRSSAASIRVLGFVAEVREGRQKGRCDAPDSVLTGSSQGAALPTTTHGQLTREIFGNVPSGGRLVFYVLAAAACASFGYGVHRRARLWRLGRDLPSQNAWVAGLARLLREMFWLRAAAGRRLAGLAHRLLVIGFAVLAIGTILIAVEHGLAALLGRAAGEPVFHRGVYFVIYEFVMDSAGAAFLAGCLMLVLRGYRAPAAILMTHRGTALSTRLQDDLGARRHRVGGWGLLAGFVVIGTTGFALEGLRIVRERPDLPAVSYIGFSLAQLRAALGVSLEQVTIGHRVLWWLHGLSALCLIALFPYTRLLHALAGAANVVTQSRVLGVMEPCSAAEVEQTGRCGVEHVVDFSRRQLRELDACVACGRCDDACPALRAGRPLSPRAVVQDLKRQLDCVAPLVRRLAARPGPARTRCALDDTPPLPGGVIAPETLWSCTTCSACADVCPLGVRPVDLVTDLRRYLIGSGSLRGAAGAALQKMQRSGNPWGLPAAERLRWADGLDVPTVRTAGDFEVLYWVGCAAAYDPRVQQVARAVSQLLRRAEVRFAVLGPEERCTGESARRMGDEFLFQDLARRNIDTFARYGVRKVVTHCPHCFNSFRNDYPQCGGAYEVQHHTQLLADLVASGRLPRGGGAGAERFTYHDPCYLARVSGVVAPPRRLIESAVGTPPAGSTNSAAAAARFREVPRHGCNTACCGAGGGRMWFDDAPAQRIGTDRFRELLGTEAQTVITACPFCLIMLRDGTADADSLVQVRDIAEVLAAGQSANSE